MSDTTETLAEHRRSQRRREHQDLGRRHLLDAAEEVFGQKGFHETTLKEVAEKAGFSVGSVYTFFESKDDLFRQIFQRRGAEFLADMGATLRGVEDPRDQLRRLVDFQVGFFRRHPHFGRLYLRYSSVAMLDLGNRLDDAIGARYEEAMALQAEVFHRGQQVGHFCGGDPDGLSRLFSGLVSAFQAIDPAVVSDDPEASFPMELADFHTLVQRTFSPTSSRPDATR